MGGLYSKLSDQGVCRGQGCLQDQMCLVGVLSAPRVLSGWSQETCVCVCVCACVLGTPGVHQCPKHSTTWSLLALSPSTLELPSLWVGNLEPMISSGMTSVPSCLSSVLNVAIRDLWVTREVSIHTANSQCQLQGSDDFWNGRQ